MTERTMGNTILVTSWNEWHEDAQIEPTELAASTYRDSSASGHDFTNGLSYEGYGDLYLQILRDEIGNGTEQLRIIFPVPTPMQIQSRPPSPTWLRR